MMNGIPNRPLYFYLKDIIEWFGACPVLRKPTFTYVKSCKHSINQHKWIYIDIHLVGRNIRWFWTDTWRKQLLQSWKNNKTPYLWCLPWLELPQAYLLLSHNCVGPKSSWRRTTSGGFHKWGYPNSWMVYNGKSHLEMDDLGALLQLGNLQVVLNPQSGSCPNCFSRLEVSWNCSSHRVVVRLTAKWWPHGLPQW